MPSLNFVLPHWLYWGTLAVFALIAIYMVARQKRRGVPEGPSLFVGYLFWLCAGFLGLHRFYLRNGWGFVFIPVFLAILYTTGQIRDAREDLSRTRAALESAHHDVSRAELLPGVEVTAAARERLSKAQAEEAGEKVEFDKAASELDWRETVSRGVALLMAALLLIDAALLRASYVAREEGRHNPVKPWRPPFRTSCRWARTKIQRSDEFVAYWAVISVFTYYYEVVARYLFNSPTNWVHESMFLMFGMQYTLAGAYAYHEDQHVRVDIFYAKLSPRGKAIADIITSVFFFIFIGTMLVTGYRFAADAIGLGEVSFTEWAVQYWPVKLMIPVGAVLLLLQGISKLIKDVMVVARAGA